jgi:cytochrome c oxidase subunit 3
MSSETASVADSRAPQAEHYDPVGNRLGMWLFLFTEVMLFGTLFIGYAVYVNMYRHHFIDGSHHLDKWIGVTNTVILLTSSLTMALSIATLQRSRKSLSIALMAVTMLFALAFLCIKGYEWHHKFKADIYPKSAKMMAEPDGIQVFYGMYFTMTGLHALHVVIGAVLIAVAMVLVQRGKVHKDRITLLENTGLYWHLVDLIWIYLFPLFYLLN